MMTRLSATPVARLGVSPSQITPEFDKWALLHLLKEVAPALRLKERELTVLAAHLSVLPKGPLAAINAPVSFMEVQKLLARANCMEERTFRRAEQRLEALGLVQRRLSANLRRFALRDAKGRILEAYGIDLSPLMSRIPSLLALRDRLQEETQARRNLASRISCTLAELKRWFLHRALPLPELLETLHQRARNLIRRKGTTLNDLEAMQAEVEAMAAQCTIDETPAMKRETADDIPMPDTPCKPDKTPAAAGQIDRRIESDRKDSNKEELLPATLPHWQSLQHISALYPKQPETLNELLRVILEFASFLRLSSATVTKSIAEAGIAQTLKAIDVMAENIGNIQKPDPYLRQVVRNFDGVIQ